MCPFLSEEERKTNFVHKFVDFLALGLFVTKPLKSLPHGASKRVCFSSPRSDLCRAVCRRCGAFIRFFTRGVSVEDVHGVCAVPLPRFCKSTLLLSRDPPGRRRARVAPAIKVQTWAPAAPLRGRARDALLRGAPNRNTRTSRGGRDAPREIRGPTREKDWKGVAICRLHVFLPSRRARRNVWSS